MKDSESDASNDCEDYRDEVLRAVRECSERLALCTRNKLCELYSEWSDYIASAGWLLYHPQCIKDFCEWATKAPCDR
jgi:hypothetical protein